MEKIKVIVCDIHNSNLSIIADRCIVVLLLSLAGYRA